MANGAGARNNFHAKQLVLRDFFCYNILIIQKGGEVKKLSGIAVLIVISTFVAIGSINAQDNSDSSREQQENNQPAPPLTVEEEALYNTLVDNLTKALWPPFTIDVLRLVATLADYSDELSEEDKTALDETGKTYIRARYAGQIAVWLMLDHSMVRDQQLVQRVKNLTEEIRTSAEKIKSWLAVWAKRLNCPDLGVEPSQDPPRFARWNEEIRKEKSK